MLADIKDYKGHATLVMKSGIQFMDLASDTVFKKEEPGLFIPSENAMGVVRLVQAKGSEDYHLPGMPSQTANTKDAIDVPLDETISLFNGVWMPVPYLRVKDATVNDGEAIEGPSNWARAQLTFIEEGDDPDGYTIRVTLAFDTKVADDNDQSKYLAPNHSDLKNGAEFQLFSASHKVDWFVGQDWIQDWLHEVFKDKAATALRLDDEDVQQELNTERNHIKHYLNFLAILEDYVAPPKVTLLANEEIDKRPPINVDMVLDIGNSRTCGIMVEDHAQESNGLKNRYELALRDLSQPYRLYSDPFESRAEFIKAKFGKEDHSAASGRIDAFLWPTIARIGPEATRFASRRLGIEGATGISSPKRYLWDEDVYERGWVLHKADPRDAKNLPATVSPFTDFINERGEALYAEPDSLPAFNPQYCRSSLMTFMISEIIAQALGQINSPWQRLSMPHANTPRHLRRILLTVPPSMPLPEREIFARRVKQALTLVWKSLGWHQPHEGDPYPEGIKFGMPDENQTSTPPFPEVEMKWDEATCAQVVYLFSETQNHFNGHPEEFFRVIQRPETKEHRPRAIRVASIDIGGGTSDVVISDYKLDDGAGGNVLIKPKQLFRDGFKVAGDDILLEVIQHTILKDISQALADAGVPTPEATLSRLLGDERSDVQLAQLRQQLTMQVLQPLGHHVLKLYEQYVPGQSHNVDPVTISGFFEDDVQPEDAVFDYFNKGASEDLPFDAEGFDLRNVSLSFDLNALHRLFLSNEIGITKTIAAMSEMVYLYNCDVLLLSGRPSRLPGVQAVIRALLPLPPDRIVPLHNYRAGKWYPFHKNHRIDDPKTTAAVGAMLCVLGQGRIPRFFFQSKDFDVPSTVRHIGMMDQANTIKEEEVFYADVNLDDPDYELPEEPFDMRGPTVIGFRQLNSPRWSASQLYLLDYADEEARDKLFGKTLKVQMQISKGRNQTGLFHVRAAEDDQGRNVGKKLRLKFNTLQGGSMGEQTYWLDTGCIVTR